MSKREAVHSTYIAVTREGRRDWQHRSYVEMRIVPIDAPILIGAIFGAKSDPCARKMASFWRPLKYPEVSR